jgi:thiol-disulfide isomerase/thioredoxin
MNRRSFLPAVLPAVLLTLAGLAGCGGDADAAGDVAGTGAAQVSGAGYVSGDSRAVRFAPSERQPAPPLRGRTLEGRPLDVTQLRGKVVVVNIWGSWCPPCRKEARSLERVWRETRAKGVAFVGINSRDVESRAKAFQQTFGVTYPSIVDPDGLLQLGFRGRLAAPALPTTYVIDRSGRVAARATDQLTDVRMRELLGPVLAERP